MKKLLIVVAVSSLVGCASTQKADVTPQPVVVSQIEEKKNPTVNIPYWYIQPPQSQDILYSVGTAVSGDLQLSQDMAILNAKTNLADRLNSRVGSQTKLYSSQRMTNDHDTNKQELEKATKNKINDVDVAGYIIAKSETQQDRHLFRTFVLIEYNRDKAADIIMDRIRTQKNQDTRSDFDRAFDEIDQLKIQ
jgi:ribosomal protein S17E